MSWWWPFSKKKKEEQSEAEELFQSQLQEALLRQDDLKDAARRMKEDRLKRMDQVHASIRPARIKIDSQTQTS